MRNIFSTCIYGYVKQTSAMGSLLVQVMRVDGTVLVAGEGSVTRGELQTSRIVWSAAKLFMRILVCYSL